MASQVDVGKLSRDLDQALKELVGLAWEGVAGCDGASVSVLHEGTVSTLTATQSRISDLDHAQYRNGDGPCVSAIRDHRPVVVKDYRSEDRWPAVAAEALEVGISSSLSLPLVDGDGYAVGG